jgi:hypothetical protein
MDVQIITIALSTEIVVVPSTVMSRLAGGRRLASEADSELAFELARDHVLEPGGDRTSDLAVCELWQPVLLMSM